METFESDPPSIWGEHPLATALMSGQGTTKALPSDDALRRYLPGDGITAIAVQPVRPGLRERYVIAVACADGESNGEGCLDDLVANTPLLGLYLSFLQTRRNLTADGEWHAGSSSASQSLTPRQSTILRLMSDGMKNREIAFAIGFSESTVRLETIEIYKKLGVHGRHEATQVALRLGLLEESA